MCPDGKKQQIDIGQKYKWIIRLGNVKLNAKRWQVYVFINYIGREASA